MTNQSPHLLRPGTLFAGRYHVRKFLAEGGMGAVFVGEHQSTEEKVAIKVLFPHVLSSKDTVEKFKLEAKIAARAKSDHIVRVIDAGFDDETRMPFLVMELLEGSTLEDLVEHQGPLAPDVAVRYLAQVAAGLDRAHGYTDPADGITKPIIHRDLKPSNLFLTRRETGEPLVKILDFGIAKVLSSETQMTQDVRGTPLFMAFEQAAAKPPTPRTDIWALCLITFWLLTGRHYWQSASAPDGSITALIAELVALPLVPPSARLVELGGLPPWNPRFDAWFLRCVNREPRERFATAGETITALAEALGVSLPGQAAPVSVVTLPATRSAAPPSPIEATTLAPSTQPQRVSTGADLSTPPNRLPRILALVLGGLLLLGGGLFARTQMGNATPSSPAPEPTDPPATSAPATTNIAAATSAPATTTAPAGAPPSASAGASIPAPSGASGPARSATTPASKPSAKPTPTSKPTPTKDIGSER